MPGGGTAAGSLGLRVAEDSLSSLGRCGAHIHTVAACGCLGTDLEKLNLGISRFILNLQPLTPDTELLAHLM